MSAHACFGMCVAGSGCARAVMKMRSGKVVPLCSINQGGKENGCERQSLETAPREAARGKREGEKVLRRIGEKLAQAISLPALLARAAGPFAEQRRPEPSRDRACNPSSSFPGSQGLFLSPLPHLNVPRLIALCVNAEAPCTQPPQELVGAYVHTPVAHKIAHLLLARTTAGARSQTFRSRLLSALLPPRPLSTRFASQVWPTPTTAARRPLLLFAFRPPPGERGAPGRRCPALVL